MTENRFLRIPEAAQMLGIHPNSLWRLIRQGKVPPPLAITERIKGWWLHDLEQWGRHPG